VGGWAAPRRANASPPAASQFRRRVQVATLDPFHRYKNAIDDRLENATSFLEQMIAAYREPDRANGRDKSTS
jgi:hypothetical protein